MSRATADDLRLAADWLDINDGAEDRDSCQRVAAFLRHEADKRENDAAIRAVAKEKGMTPSQVRTIVRKQQEQKG